MFENCTLANENNPIIRAFINEDGQLVVERGVHLSRQFIIKYPTEMAGEWIASEPAEYHISIPYGPQGIIYKRTLLEDTN